jgi:hypothetical protein
MACRYLPPRTLFNMVQYTPERMHRMVGWTRCFRSPHRLRRGQVLTRQKRPSALGLAELSKSSMWPGETRRNTAKASVSNPLYYIIDASGPAF